MKKMTIYRKPKQESLFEEEYTLETLSAMGNPLEQVSALISCTTSSDTAKSTNASRNSLLLEEALSLNSALRTDQGL